MLASSEVVNLWSIACLILLCIWLLLTYRLTPLWTLKVSTCLSSAPKQTLSKTAALSFSLLCLLLGRGSAPLCGVVSMVNYLHLRRLGPGPLFLCKDGTPLSRSKLSVFLKCTLQSAGVPENFSSHSFRIRAATTAASWGIPDILLKLLKLWVTGQANLICCMCWLQ